MNYDHIKIYDVILKNNEYYFLDVELKLIFNKKKDIVGIINNKKELLFYSTIDNLINNIQNTHNITINNVIL